MTVYEKLLKIKNDKGAGYLVLIDPDKGSIEKLTELAKTCEKQEVDGLLIGGSLLLSTRFDELVKAIKKAVSIPVILFPGSSRQISAHADAILFMSLISGRNPQNLIGEQVMAAPVVRETGIEPISMGYMLVESGQTTSAEFISNTRPLPRNKPEIAVAHALAAEYLGMKLVYLEGGSGADHSVPEEMIQAVESVLSIPLIVGGGIRNADEAGRKVKAGASFIVTGNFFESQENEKKLIQFAETIHNARQADTE